LALKRVALQKPICIIKGKNIMEKIETSQPKEKICKICGGPHSQYNCTKKVDIKARRKEYIEKLKKGEPDLVETMKEVQREGFSDIETRKEEVREELLEGKPQEVKKRKEELREGKSLGGDKN